jgi:restriction system protein
MHSEIEEFKIRHSISGIPLYFYSSVDGKTLDRKAEVSSGQELDVVLETNGLRSRWDQQWEKISQLTNSETNQGIDRGYINKFFVALAKELTEEAEDKVSRIQSILVNGLNSSEGSIWEILWDFYFFNAPSLKKCSEEKLSEAISILSEPEPNISDQKYKVTFGFIERLIGEARKMGNINTALFESDHASWLQRKKLAEVEVESANEAIQGWERRESENAKALITRSKAIDKLKSQYEAGNADAIVEYCDIALGMSDFPDCIQNIYDLEYTPSTQTLLIEFLLPNVEDLPKVKEWKFTATKGLLSAKELTVADRNRLYDEFLYQISLRVIHEIFDSDKGNYIDGIVFNGRVAFTNKSTGHEESACILSIQASKDEFLAINLSKVVAKDCFKLLKGVGSSKLHGLSAIAPIMTIRREDGRFVSAQEIANTINDSTNLASMDWQDFEHLIREIFEKEFSVNGGEVKITQASRDGGVDAVAFDPDPIRGGKTVIQAKRYTNTVTVSAVRDLYGTVMHERANKGILVTTSDFGPDAYNFIRDKPLVLLNGANLLHLLEKHGHKARIDLQEAKLMNG